MNEASESGDERELRRLMVAYQAGGRAAFERLYEILQGELQRFFVAAIRDRDLAADLTQESFLEIHRSRRLYLPPLPVRPWVFGVARNVLRRHRRTIGRRSRHEGAGGDLHRGGDGAAPRSTPDYAPRFDLDRALDTLPAGRRAAWWLHHAQGLSFEQVGRRLRIGAGAAKLRSSRAMKTLRAVLGVGGGDER
jgi:RNA polymerase sigma-70 factor, ECF subfamily